VQTWVRITNYFPRAVVQLVYFYQPTTEISLHIFNGNLFTVFQKDLFLTLKCSAKNFNKNIFD